MEQIEAYHLYSQEWEDYEQLCADFEWDIPEKANIAHYICDRWADADGERTAAYFEDADDNTDTYTFSRLQEEANKLANFLRDRGIQRGDRVAIDGSQKPEILTAHIATLKLGAVVVPMSSRFGPDALHHRLADSDAKAYVANGENVRKLRDIRNELPQLSEVLVVGPEASAKGEEVEFETAIDSEQSTFATVQTDAEDYAYILYTSGTTGPPKGVVHAHRFLFGHLPMFIGSLCNLELREDDVVRVPVEWSWIGSLFALIAPTLYFGKPIVGYAEDFEPEKELDLMDRYDVSVTSFPNTALRMMTQVSEPNDRFDLSSIRVIVSGGEALDDSSLNWALETLDAVVVQAYGQTEANALLGNFPKLKPNKPKALGLPGPGREISLVDQQTAEPITEPETVGEIAVEYEDDPVCFVEYWNQPEKTAEKVQDGLLLTEDLAWRDEDGFYHFKSRKDDVIISSGHRIGPEELEDHIGTHDSVAAVAVIGIPDETRGEVPKAFVELTEEYGPSEELRASLQSYTKDQLAAYKYPREIEFVDELPRSTTNKIQRSELRKMEGLVE